jgi:trans-2,3-dihydro-3-hydroxyanthranilate isomerase
MRYHLLDVFTDQVFGGNPLAVFPEMRPTETAVMQKIAAELGLSETVFVFPPTRAGTNHRLRIFTPRMELPFAGHPTIGTAVILAALGAAPAEGQTVTLHLEENAGVVPVEVRWSNGALYAELRVPEVPRLGPAAPARADLAALIGLTPAELAPAPDDPCTASAGVPFLMIPVADLEALGRARLDLTRWRSMLADAWAPHVYVLCHDGDRRLRVRMFAPAMGIAEDPATGAAAAALPAYLARQFALGVGPHAWTVLQGIEVGRPSQVDLRFDVTPIGPELVRIGGGAVRVAEGRLLL